MLAWFVASLAGLTLLVNEKVAQAAANAGFEVSSVDVRGTKRLNQLKVYDQVLGERNRAMTQVDLQALRAKVMTLSLGSGRARFAPAARPDRGRYRRAHSARGAAQARSPGR